VGLATIKGFAFGLNKPVVGVASLDTLAQSVNASGCICPVVDAKRSLVYSALYERKDRLIRRKSRYFLLPIKELLSRIKKDTVFLGDGLLIYRGEIEKHIGKKAHFSDSELWYPQPEALFELTEKKIKNKEFSDAARITPLYLYPKECQIRGRRP